MFHSVRFLNKLGEPVQFGEGWVFMCGGQDLFVFSPKGEMMTCDARPQNYYGEPSERWDLHTDNAALFADRFLLILAGALDLGLELFENDEEPCFARLDYGDRRVWRLVKLPA